MSSISQYILYYKLTNKLNKDRGMAYCTSKDPTNLHYGPPFTMYKMLTPFYSKIFKTANIKQQCLIYQKKTCNEKKGGRQPAHSKIEPTLDMNMSLFLPLFYKNR